MERIIPGYNLLNVLYCMFSKDTLVHAFAGRVKIVKSLVLAAGQAQYFKKKLSPDFIYTNKATLPCTVKYIFHSLNIPCCLIMIKPIYTLSHCSISGACKVYTLTQVLSAVISE